MTRIWEIPESTADRELCAHAVSQAIMQAKAGMVVKLMRESKSDRQRGIFHALCREIGKPLGYTEAEIKDLIKEDFLGYTEIKIGDRWRRVLRSTEQLDKGDYSGLIEYVDVWRGLNGI